MIPKFRAWNTIVRRMSKPFTLDSIPKGAQWHILKIMQYAGFTNKGGLELIWCQGDIIEKNNGAKAEIIFENGCFLGSWLGEITNGLARTFRIDQNHQRPEWFKVIGNIHETRDLLETS